MGDVIQIDDLRRRREARGTTLTTDRSAARSGHAAVTFWFDLRGVCGAATYLAAERVDRQLEKARWRPALVDRAPVDLDAAWRSVDERARALRMPLLAPEDVQGSGQGAMRVAHLAASRNRGSQFVLAVGRMAFCGGYDLDDPEVLATAADAAGLAHDEALAAARDEHRDLLMLEAGRRLGGAAGAPELPVLQVAGRLLGGEGRVAEAVAVARSHA